MITFISKYSYFKKVWNGQFWANGQIIKIAFKVDLINP